MGRSNSNQKPLVGNPRPRSRRLWQISLAGMIILIFAIGLYWSSRSDDAVVSRRGGTPSQDSDELHSPGSISTLGPDSLPTLSTATSNSRQIGREQLLDPQSDGWQTESIAADVSAVLKRFAKLLQNPQRINPTSLREIAAQNVSVGVLRAKQLSVVFQDDSIVVRRDTSGNSSARRAIGQEKMVHLLQELSDVYEGATNIRVNFKVVRVDPISKTMAATRIFFESRGRTDSGTLQQTAVWDVQWERQRDKGELRIQSIQSSKYEEVEAGGDTGTWFADCTESVLGETPCYREQLRYGADHWMRRLESHLSPRLLEGQIGFAIGDADGDELEDIYVCQPGGLPNRLLLQNPDGSVRDASRQSGVDVLDWSYASLFLDLDNDGDQDLAVATGKCLLLFANDGHGRFSLKTKHAGAYEYSLTSVDYDNDGMLDLYLCNYVADRAAGLSRFGRPVPFFNATNGGENVLLRNDGNWTLTDVTAQVGLDRNNTRWSYSASWEDYDNDGDMDLYVANDFGHNNLYRNDQGHFHDVAPAANAIDANFGMSVSWGDYNRDGWMDIYISNMFSAAGHRVTSQSTFKPTADRLAYQQLARGNTLLQNAGDGTFRDVSLQAGVTMGRWSWGSLFADVNNDGWDDLLVCNGYLSQAPNDDL
ncbi:MAG: VCBS repeat-containing protein [Pirellulaceae bacterium]|nr:VCBS repeat-containing protein [Pirellulaceae bacterium]